MTALIPAAAQASCGAAFCPVNTQWNTQGVWTEPGWRADLRYEYVRQDTPRSGSGKVAFGAIPRHHDEVKTINRNTIATLDYGAANGFGVTAVLPVVDRNHTHIHNHMGGKIIDSWNFSEIGDAQVIGRYQFQNWDNPYVFGVYFGTKLPTGKIHVRNAGGDVAERTLQPGTGTTDALLGGYIRQNLPSLNSSWFAQAMVQAPVRERENFRPGEKLSVDLGYRYDVMPRLSLMLQINAHHKERDRGQNAEPRESGGESISLSPGVSYGLTESLQLYGFVQKPVYQYVNGVQITPDWSVATGVSVHF